MTEDTRMVRQGGRFYAPTRTPLAASIRAARINAGMSQRQLAECVGVARERIADWETSKRVPNAERLTALRSTLGVEL
jgi:transcriptional regulator with XRE-family HTH domain